MMLTMRSKRLLLLSPLVIVAYLLFPPIQQQQTNAFDYRQEFHRCEEKLAAFNADFNAKRYEPPRKPLTSDFVRGAKYATGKCRGRGVLWIEGGMFLHAFRAFATAEENGSGGGGGAEAECVVGHEEGCIVWVIDCGASADKLSLQTLISARLYTGRPFTLADVTLQPIAKGPEIFKADVLLEEVEVDVASYRNVTNENNNNNNNHDGVDVTLHTAQDAVKPTATVAKIVFMPQLHGRYNWDIQLEYLQDWPYLGGKERRCVKNCAEGYVKKECETEARIFYETIDVMMEAKFENDDVEVEATAGIEGEVEVEVEHVGKKGVRSTDYRPICTEGGQHNGRWTLFDHKSECLPGRRIAGSNSRGGGGGGGRGSGGGGIVGGKEIAAERTGLCSYIRKSEAADTSMADAQGDIYIFKPADCDYMYPTATQFDQCVSQRNIQSVTLFGCSIMSQFHLGLLSFTDSGGARRRHHHRRGGGGGDGGGGGVASKAIKLVLCMGLDCRLTREKMKRNSGELHGAEILVLGGGTMYHNEVTWAEVVKTMASIVQTNRRNNPTVATDAYLFLPNVLNGSKWPYNNRLNRLRSRNGLAAWNTSFPMYGVVQQQQQLQLQLQQPLSTTTNTNGLTAVTNMAEITAPRYDATGDGVHYTKGIIAAQNVDFLASLCGAVWAEQYG